MSEKQYRTLMLPPTGKKRDDYFDIVRGIAVFLMLWGHSIQYSSCGTFDFFENRLYQFIYSFHMPLFMLLAGYFFYFSLQKHAIGNTLLNRVRSLGIPLLVWGFFSVLCNYWLYKSPISISQWYNSCKGFWFVWVTLALSIITGLIEWCISLLSKLFTTPLYSLLHVVVFLLVILIPNNIPILRYHLFQYMYPYFIIGFLYNRFKSYIPKVLYYAKYLCFLLFPLLFTHFKRNTFIYLSGINFRNEFGMINTAQLKVDLLRWGIGLVGSICVMICVELFKKIPCIGKILRILFAYIGTVSLQLYVTQRICLETLYAFKINQLFQTKNFTLMLKNIYLYNLYWTPLVAVLFCLILYFVVKLLQKNKFLNFILFGGR